MTPMSRLVGSRAEWSRVPWNRGLSNGSGSSAPGSPDEHPAVRWSLWLGAGVVFGLGLGFVLGLTRPRTRATM